MFQFFSQLPDKIIVFREQETGYMVLIFLEMLEDMVAAAINATVKQVDETAEAEMGKLTGGMNIPGL